MVVEFSPSRPGDRLVPYSCLGRVLVFLFIRFFSLLASWLPILLFLNCFSVGDNIASLFKTYKFLTHFRSGSSRFSSLTSGLKLDTGLATFSCILGKEFASVWTKTTGENDRSAATWGSDTSVLSTVSEGGTFGASSFISSSSASVSAAFVVLCRDVVLVWCPDRIQLDDAGFDGDHDRSEGSWPW